jgi:hypothetical protein
MSNTNEARRLIIVGDGPQERWEPFFAAVAEDYDVALVSSDYPSWQAKYVEYHRISKITNFSTLFAAVADLRGEVSDAAVLTWEKDPALQVARIAERLRMRSMSVEAVRACLDAEAGPGVLTAFSVTRAGEPEIVSVIRDGELVESWTPRLESVVREAHRKVGADWGVASTRLAVTAEDGLAVAGIATWLDQDALPPLAAIPTLAKLSAGVLFDPERIRAAA